MDERLDKLLKNAFFGNPEERENAVVWLITMLERENCNATIGGYATAEDFYRQTVPAELLTVAVDSKVQAELARRVATFAGKVKEMSICFVLLGKMQTNAALMPVVEVITAYEKQFDAMTLRHAHYALTALLGLPIDKNGRPTGASLPKALVSSGLVPALTRFVRDSLRSSDYDVQEAAATSKHFLEAYGVMLSDE